MTISAELTFRNDTKSINFKTTGDTASALLKQVTELFTLDATDPQPQSAPQPAKSQIHPQDVSTEMTGAALYTFAINHGLTSQQVMAICKTLGCANNNTHGLSTPEMKKAFLDAVVAKSNSASASGSGSAQ